MDKNNNRFVAIDFETMSTWRASVCSIGLCVIEKNKIVDGFYSLVCPESKEENPYCVAIHGLTYKDVKEYPTWEELWPVLDEKYIKGSPLIAHNHGFEKSCINACADAYDTNSDYEYIDTMNLGKKYIKGIPNKKLDTICESLNVSLKHHHNALDDAMACANIFIKLNKKHKLYGTTTN